MCRQKAFAPGMAFADTLIAHTGAEVVLVDRVAGRAATGLTLIRSCASTSLPPTTVWSRGSGRPDRRARAEHRLLRACGAAEICDYYARVLDESLLPTGRVRFFGMSDHRGGNGDGRLVVSLLDGSETVVMPRRKVVDATYVQSEIPSRHVPDFTVEPGVRLVPPNSLVDLEEPADRFTVIGAGKTASTPALAARGRRRPRPHPLDPGSRSVAVRPHLHAAARPGRVVHAAAGAVGRGGGRSRARPRPRATARGRRILVRIDPRSSRWRFAAPPSAHARSTLSARSSTSCARGAFGSSGRPRSPPTRATCPAARARSTSTVRPRSPCCASATGVRAGPHHDPVCGRRLPALVRRHDRIRRVDRPRRQEKNRLCPPVVFSGDVADLPSLAYAVDAGPGRSSPPRGSRALERRNEAKPRSSRARPHRRSGRRRVARVHDHIARGARRLRLGGRRGRPERASRSRRSRTRSLVDGVAGRCRRPRLRSSGRSPRRRARPAGRERRRRPASTRRPGRSPRPTGGACTRSTSSACISAAAP